MSPLALACALFPVQAHIRQQVPEALHLLYADDRSVFGPPDALVRTEALWEEFCQSTRMKTNTAKTQKWQLGSEAPDQSGVVLGCVLAGHAGQHLLEKQRSETLTKVARRITVLPVSIQLRAQLARAVLSSKQVWDQFITGRTLPQIGRWPQFFRDTCLKHLGGRASRELEKAFRWGHSCDLEILGVQRFLSTVNSWWHRVGAQIDWAQLSCCYPWCFTKVTLTLRKWRWRQLSWGLWSHPCGWFLNVGASAAEFPGMLHSLRESWRRTCFVSWLSHRKRIDSRMAREAGLNYIETLSNDLRKLIQSLPADAVAVALGGMKTPATC